MGKDPMEKQTQAHDKKTEHSLTMAEEQTVNEACKVYKVWNKIGGSFQKALAEALVQADSFNQFKIKLTWFDEWNTALKQYPLIKGLEV